MKQISKDVFEVKILIEKNVCVDEKWHIVCSSILIYEIEIKRDSVGGLCGDDVLKTSQ